MSKWGWLDIANCLTMMELEVSQYGIDDPILNSIYKK